ncbi:hypothetical protein JHK86_036038 [Glycine max]|nr:hypothetical protein JHK86_036038 [Glycine max]
MVWFQCEDCGDNLKNPSCLVTSELALPTNCRALTVGKYLGVTPFRITRSVSQKRLCNTKATSKQTLLLHADGKKHRAKARAFHASKQQPVEADKSTTDAKVAVETAPNDDVRDGKNGGLPKLQESSEQNNSKPGNEISSAKKKRKLEALEDDRIKKTKNDTSVDMGNGEVIQGEEATGESNLKKERSAVKNKIKWKKFIKSALKSHPDRILKMKKLRKVVLRALQECGIVVDDTELSEALEQKINSSSRFAVENKYVRLLAKD